MSLRLNRINETIVHEVSNVLRIHFREETAMVTIVGALVSPDLKSAYVKFSVVGNNTDVKKIVRFFSKNKGFIKQKVNSKMQLQNMPDIKFVQTDAIEKGNKLIDILDEIESQEICLNDNYEKY